MSNLKIDAEMFETLKEMLLNRRDDPMVKAILVNNWDGDDPETIRHVKKLVPYYYGLHTQLGKVLQQNILIDEMKETLNEIKEICK